MHWIPFPLLPFFWDCNFWDIKFLKKYEVPKLTKVLRKIHLEKFQAYVAISIRLCQLKGCVWTAELGRGPGWNNESRDFHLNAVLTPALPWLALACPGLPPCCVNGGSRSFWKYFEDKPFKFSCCFYTFSFTLEICTYIRPSQQGKEGKGFRQKR